MLLWANRLISLWAYKPISPLADNLIGFDFTPLYLKHGEIKKTSHEARLKDAWNFFAIPPAYSELVALYF
jgi:hypothetical protein